MAAKKYETFEVTADGQIKIYPGSSIDAVVAELNSLGANITKRQLRDANEQWVTNNKLSKGVFTSRSEIKLNIEGLPYEALGLQYSGPSGDSTQLVTDETEMETNPEPFYDPNYDPNANPEVDVDPNVDATPMMAFDVFKDVIGSLLNITDTTLLQDIYNASKKYLAEGIDTYLIPDILAGSADAPASFKAFLGDFTKIKSLNVGVTTIAEFTKARSEYKALMRYYGLDEYVSDASADKFLMNQVSVDEAANRMEVAFNAIKYADEALKQQLKTYFPSLSDKDIAANILGVGKTVAELQQQIGMSGIRAEAATAGIAGRLTAEELYSQGVTRERARQGYQEVAAATPLAEAAALRGREDASTIQTELEKENLLGLRSQRRARLAAREQSYFAGKSGTAQVSLGGSTSGAF